MADRAQAVRSGEITRACLDNGMSASDACETAAILLPLIETWLKECDTTLRAGVESVIAARCAGDFSPLLPKLRALLDEDD